MIGRVISGRYAVQDLVGTGGMAMVYRAYDKVKKRNVAIKVLRPQYESDEEFVRRFSREAEAASKVSHENIVSTLDVGIDDGMRYIVMEYVEGSTLKQMIRDHGRIAPDQALRMTIRILAAVDHAHRNGIVHRDIKPQNILVDKHGKVKVADFGIARLKTTQASQINTGSLESAVGSVHYFSPEQARGEVADEKSDLYSVGVVLYEMLTGQVPFDGENAVAVALKHVREEPKSVRMLQGDVSKALDEVVMRALTKDAGRRYQTAAEMAADLRKTITHPKGGFVKYPLPSEELAKQREAKKRKLRRRLIRFTRAAFVSSVVLVILAVFVSVWYYFNLRNHVIEPTVTGMEIATAQALLDEAGLPVIVEYVYSENIPESYVISQSGEPEKRVSLDTEIRLVVSAGPEWFDMINCLGKTELEANTLLRAAGARIIRVEYMRGEGAIGTVIGQTPAAGRQHRDEEVVLTVSGQSAVVPPVTGLTLEAAVALLEAEGLTVGTVTEGETVDEPANIVLSQSIAADREILAGSAVNLTVSPTVSEMYRTPEPLTVSVPMDNVLLEVIVTSVNGTTNSTYRQTVKKGPVSVPLTASEPGMHTVQIYMDTVLMESIELMFV